MSSVAAGTAFAEIDVQMITAPSLRLDLDADRARLDKTVATLKPRLLILDPFVRLHRIDENVSGDVAPLLALLRERQRRHAVAIAVVHHARKSAGTVRAGQALRGSSEFPAWVDSNLYLHRDGDDRIVLTVEHRAAASIAAVTLELAREMTTSPCSPFRPTTKTSPVSRPLPSINAAPPPWPKATSREPSPNCAYPAGSAPRLCTSISPQ